MKRSPPRLKRTLSRATRLAFYLLAAGLVGQIVSLGFADTGEPDNSGATGTILTPTENTVQTHGSHSLSSSDTEDWFRIAMTAGRRYCFTSATAMAASAGDGDVVAYLYSDSAGTSQVATNDDGAWNYQFWLCYTAAASQTYYLKIKTFTAAKTWYGDVHFWYTLNDTAPAATTNNSDYQGIRVDASQNVATGGDCCFSGGTDHNLRVYLDGAQVINTGRCNDCGSAWNWNPDLTGTANVGRNAVAQVRMWYTDEDGGSCEGWSCEDTMSNHTFAVGGLTTPDPAPAAWVWLTQDNAPCDSYYDDLQVYVGVHNVYDRGVGAPGGLSATPTTDTGTNGTMTISWSAVADRSGINDYWFQLDDENTFAAPQIISKSVGASTSINVGFGLLKPGTTYYWRVAARSACNNVDRKICADTSGGYHVAYTTTQSFAFSDDDTTQPDMGTVNNPGGNIYDSATQYSVDVTGGGDTNQGDDTSPSVSLFTCIHGGTKYCSTTLDQVPVSGTNPYSWDSGDRNADSSNVPSVEMDYKITQRSSSQIRWYFEDFSVFGENDAITDGQGDWAQATIPQVTAATVGYPGRQAQFVIDSMTVTMDLQTYMDEWCAGLFCGPDESNPTMTVQYNRFDDGAWSGWTNLGTYSPIHGWTTRNFTLLANTTNSAVIADWNDGGNIIDIRVVLGGTAGADALETEYEDMYVRYPEVHAQYTWHILSYSAVTFEPIHTLGVTNFNCLVEDMDNDRGQNTDCSPSSSLDMDFDCVNGAGSTGRGNCTNFPYTVIDDDTTAPSVTFDAPSYVNGLVSLTAGASDPVEGDDSGINKVDFYYDTNAGDGCATWVLIATDSGAPDCNPSHCVNWTPPGTPPGNDGTYCLKAVATDNDNDRSGDELTGETVDNNVIVDRQTPNNPTISSVKVDNGSCTGANLLDNTWQNLSSDPCFTWTAATDNGLAGINGYWFYYGTNCTNPDPETAGGWNGSSTTWTNGTSPGEGTFCFWIKTKDNAGNKSSPVKLYTIKYDNVAPIPGTVTPANTATTTHVDGTYDLSTTFTDATSNVTSCQYTTNGSTWTAATWNAGTCSITGLTCTNGTALTLNMRADDAVPNTGTGASVARTCDTVAPSGGSISYSNAYSALTTGFSVSFVNPTDGGAGIASRTVQKRTGTLSAGSCSAYGSWSAFSTNPAASPVADTPLTTATCYQYQYVIPDNVGNSVTYCTDGASCASLNEYKVDTTAPSAAAGLTVVNSGSQTLKLTWTNGSDAQSGLQKHVAYRCSAVGADCAPSVINIDPTGSNPCYDENDANCADAAGAGALTEDPTRYCYFVRAVNNAGTEDGNSTTVCATSVIANESIAAEIKGYPASAVNQAAAYIGTYVGAGNTLYLLNASGTQVATSGANIPAGETIVESPIWAYESATLDYAYVGTNDASNIGRIYKFKNNELGAAGPDGNTLTLETGWPVMLPDKCAGANGIKVQTATVPDGKLVHVGAVDADCPITTEPKNYIFGYEIKVDAYGAAQGCTSCNNSAIERIVDVGGCSGGTAANQRSTPTVKETDGTLDWSSAVYMHIGSDCSNGELYRVRLDAGLASPPAVATANCQKNVAGEIRAWLTGGAGALFFGTMGGAAARFYAIQSTEGAASCSETSPDPYSNLFTPYPPGASVSKGAKVNWQGPADEAYFVSDDGKVHCVCQNATAPCTGAGVACSGFPVDLTGANGCGTLGSYTCGSQGYELREPILKDGTLYVPCNSGKTTAIEMLSDPVADNALGGEVTLYDPPGAPSELQAPPDIPSGTIKLRNGFPFGLGVSLCSTVALRTSTDTRIAVGTDAGKVFYLPLIPNNK